MRPWGCVQSISTSKDHLPERRFNDTMFHLESSYPLSSIFLSAKQSRARHGFKQQRVVNLIRPSLLIISSDDDICSSDNVKDKPSIRPPVCISTALKRAPDLRKIDRLVAEMRDAFGTIPCFLPSKILHAISQSARSSCLTLLRRRVGVCL